MADQWLDYSWSSANAQNAVAPLSLGNVTFGIVLATQSPAWLALSPRLGWTPRYAFNDKVGLRADFGFSPLARITGGLVASFDYSFLYSYNFSKHFQVEAGAGAQTWVNYGGTSALLKIDGSLILNGELAQNNFKLARASVGYATVFSANFTQIYSLNAGFEF